jgi:hypothetical protein
VCAQRGNNNDTQPLQERITTSLVFPSSRTITLFYPHLGESASRSHLCAISRPDFSFIAYARVIGRWLRISPCGIYIFDQRGEGANRDNAKKELIALNLRHQLFGKTSGGKIFFESLNCNRTQKVV